MGWSRGEITAALTILYIMNGVVSPLIGRLVDRFRVKLVITAGTLVMTLGFILLSQVNNLWLFYLGFIIIGIGSTAMGPVPTSAVVSRWFQKRRGLAIGLMSTGVGAAGFVSPVIGGLLIPTIGWRYTYLMLGLVTAVVIIPLVLFLMKESPLDIGYLPDGERTPITHEQQRLPSSYAGLTGREAVTTIAFWLLTVSFFSSQFSQVGAVQSQAPYLGDLGFSVVTTSTALGLVGVGSAVGKISFGWLCDRMSPKYVCLIGLGLALAGIMTLMYIRTDSPAIIIWFYVGLIGLGVGSWFPTLSMLTSTNFGLRAYGTIFGMMSLAMNLGSAIGPLVAGLIYDFTGSYHQAFVLFALLYVVAIPSILAVRRPNRFS